LKESRYIIGIDLGTTNSTLSYIDTENSAENDIQAFAIPQLVDEGVVKDLKALPSFLYLPGEYELPAEATALPWDKNTAHIAGEFARLQGARVPANLVSSAKSWLCHNRVDREGPILPWGRDTAEKKISPLEASAHYLGHMKDAWNFAMARGDRSTLLENQQIIITIPASFDESARELTAEAARKAGIEDFTMLEEPQAAFYAWISSNKDNWRDLTGKRGLALVFDVGGGTTDFTLISIDTVEGKPSFQRVAVGDHIMLGGDNMDLTLARNIERAMTGPSGKFDFHQWLSAAHQCRMAKEELLGNAQKKSVPVSVLGKGRSVVGGARKVELKGEEISDTIIDGFFKEVEVSEEVDRRRTAGLQELGLPFESDTAIMKHLSSFLKRHAANKDLNPVTDNKSGLTIVRPDILLFNGGVFKSRAIRDHAAAIIREWFSGGEWSLNILENDEFDQAVSIGAAYYGLVLRGKGERISGGTGKAYYIAVETTRDRTERELKNPVTLVCIVPRGIEEGAEIHLSKPEFQVMTNSPVSFSLYSSSYRAGDRAGDIITAEKEEFIELPPVRTVLHYGKKTGSLRIPVSLGIRVNEFGTMDVWCESIKTSHRWKLAFQLREEAEDADVSLKKKGMEHTLDESAITKATELMDIAFHSSPRIPSEVTPENVIKKIEKLLDLNRKEWPLFAIRKMWDALAELKERRGTSAMHEARWINLSGFLLRPGFGYELDDVRIKDLWTIFLADLQFANNGQCRSEWWILWRRVAGGFDSAKQDIIFRKIVPWLLPTKKKTKKLSGAEVAEMWMLAASLENLSPPIKTELGDTLIKSIKKAKGKSQDQYYWAISRVGARSPFHGSIDRVVSKEAAEKWIEELLKEKWSNPTNVTYTIAQLARKTDDRTRDINDDLRSRVIERLSQYDWSDHFIKQIQEVLALEWEDEKEIFGESLPVGLYIEN
jgi:actin-like ATPase involved in cell morphogenesis